MSALAPLLAAALALGIWPAVVGPPELVVGDVEVYTAEPDDDFWIVAMEALVPPLAVSEEERVAQIVSVASRLQADAVLLLAESAVSEIPEDPEQPLPTTGRYAAAVFLVLDLDSEEEVSELQSAARFGGDGMAAGGEDPPAPSKEESRTGNGSLTTRAREGSTTCASPD